MTAATTFPTCVLLTKIRCDLAALREIRTDSNGALETLRQAQGDTGKDNSGAPGSAPYLACWLASQPARHPGRNHLDSNNELFC